MAIAFHANLSSHIPPSDLLSEQMSFYRRIRRHLCRPLPIAFLLCLIVTSVVLSFVRSYRNGDTVIRGHFLMPEDVSAPVPVCPESEDPTTALCSPTTTEEGEERIPRIIHQTYKTVKVPNKWLEAYKSCKEIHQANNWTHVMWTDEDAAKFNAAKFIAAKYPWFFDTYIHYPYAIQRADTMRYFIQHHYGGFYLDLDVGCRRDLFPLLKYNAIFPKTEPLSVSNDVMAASKNHPLFQQLISSLTGHNYWFGTKYPTVIFSTGLMFVSQEVVKFIRTHDRLRSATAPDALSLRSLHPTLCSMAKTSFFAHYRGSTWHGGDVVLGTFVWHNKLKITALLSILLVCVYFLGSPACYNRSRRAVLGWISDTSPRDN